jgi:hypothetical protein
MSCGSPHLDILSDSTAPVMSTGGSLELDRIKDKIRSIWNSIIVSHYNEEYKNQKDEDEDYVAMEDYLEENRLYFPGEEQPESEVDNILSMLDTMFDDKEELEPISKEGNAPTYQGSNLKSNNEKGKIESTSYEVKHTSTKTPGDSKSTVTSSTYDTPTSGKIAPRKDSKVHRSFSPMIKKIVEELRSLEERQNIGRRKQLFRL